MENFSNAIQGLATFAGVIVVLVVGGIGLWLWAKQKGQLRGE